MTKPRKQTTAKPTKPATTAKNAARGPEAAESANARARPTGDRADTHLRPKRPPGVDWAPEYLDALATTGEKVKACADAKVGVTTVWDRRQRDPQFAKDEKCTLEIARDIYESEAVRRAVRGTVDEHFDRDGKLVSRKTTYSDTILLRLLGRLDPTWREKYVVEPTNDLPATREERLAALAAARAERDRLNATLGRVNGV